MGRKIVMRKIGLLGILFTSTIMATNFDMFIETEQVKQSDKNISHKPSLNKARKPFTLESMYKGGCDNKIGRHCGNLGVLYEIGHGGKKDPTKARKYYDLACKYGEKKYCRDYNSSSI